MEFKTHPTFQFGKTWRNALLKFVVWFETKDIDTRRGWIPRRTDWPTDGTLQLNWPASLRFYHAASNRTAMILISLKAKLYNQLSGRFITVDRNFGCQFCTEAGAHKNVSFTWQCVRHAMQMPALIRKFMLPFCVRNKFGSFKSAHVAVCQGQIRVHAPLQACLTHWGRGF